MFTTIVQHDVQDFATWKQGFDAHHAARGAAGVTHHTIGQLEGKPNTVVLVADWTSRAAFEAMFQNPEFMKVMKEAGVIGEPQVTFVDRTEHGHY